MKSNKLLAVIVAIEAIFIPFSVFSALGSILTISSIGTVFGQSILLGMVSLISMILNATYTITFLICAFKTLSEKEISIISFLPLIHFLLARFFYLF